MCRHVQQPPLGPNDASKVKVRFTLGQTTRVQREKRGKALLFLYLAARWGGWLTPRSDLFTSGKRPGTHCTGGLVGLRAGLDRYGKFHPNRDSIPEPSSP
jgi:hypothetical protein